MTNGTMGGFLGLLMAELSKAMNFTIKFMDPEKSYGSWNYAENMWTGAIGQLVYDEADIGVSEFAITPDRLNAVDFTMPLRRSRNRLYFRQPSSSDVSWSKYFKVIIILVQVLI